MENLEDLIKKTHSLYKEGREKEMLPYFEKAIIILRKNNDIPRLIEVLINYAGALRVAGQFNEAISNAIEAINLIKKYYSTTSEPYATALMNLANIYRMKGNYEISESIFLEAEKILKSLNINNYSAAGLYNNLSLLYQSMGDYNKAYIYQLKSVEINRKDTKYLVPLAISYNNLYEICKNLNKLDEGQKYLNEAQNILIEEVGVSHPLYCSVLNNFANLCFLKNELDKSLALYKLILPLMEKFYGKDSKDYKAILNNYNFIQNKLNNNKINSNGMTLAKNFFESEIFPTFKKHFPNLLNLVAFGLVGAGSECFGYDDEISKDHDFGKRCCVFLDDEIPYEIYKNISATLNKLDGKVEIYYISQFYQKYTSFKNGPKTIEEYRCVPSDYLATATNGEVFYDGNNKFTEIRNRLKKFYPQDLIYKKMAYSLNKMAQSGQYNYDRCLKRNNIIGANMALNEFIIYYCHFMHLINKKYMPFYKWYQRSLKDLKINLGNMNSAQKIIKLLELENSQKSSYIEKLCIEIKDYLIMNNLSKVNEAFLTYQASEVIKNVKDSKLRNEDTWSY